MIKILVEANNLSVQKKCEFISYLYNNYDEIDYKFIEKWSGLAPSTVRNYRYRGDKTITEKNKQLFASFIQIVEKKRRQNCEFNVLYDNDTDFQQYRNGIATTYICEIYGNNSFLYTKIGKSIHLHNRMKDHSRNEKYGSDKVVVKKVYAFEDEEESLIMESLMRKYFKNIYKENFIRNDRFANVHITETDEEKIAELYEKIISMGIE